MSQMYDPNVKEEDVGAMPTFRIKSVLDKKKSAEMGCDHFKEAEWVEIRVRGDNTTVIDVPVTDEYRKRFASSYAKFREGKEQKYGDGFPLEQWPLIGKPMVDTLNAQHVYTVEQLAEFPDSFMHKLHQGQTWKQRAIKWLGERNPDIDSVREEMARLQALVSKQTEELTKLKRRKKQPVATTED